MHRDPNCCIILFPRNWICCTLITEILKGNLRGREVVSASWSQKGLVSWLLSNFKSRTWTVSLAGTVVNSHSTSKDTMIWLSWSFSLEILKMKCNEFFTMSAALPPQEWVLFQWLRHAESLNCLSWDFLLAPQECHECYFSGSGVQSRWTAFHGISILPPQECHECYFSGSGAQSRWTGFHDIQGRDQSDSELWAVLRTIQNQHGKA